MKTLGFSLTAAAAALMINATPIMAADSAELEARINEINARYEQTYDQYKAEGDRLAERAPEGAETAVGIDFDVREKRHEVILDLPTINMREKRIVLDLPQVTMKDRRFSFTTVKSKMEVKKVGQYPEWHGPFKMVWKDILTKVPVFWEEETSFVVKIPEFTWDTTTLVMHLPDVEMAEQRYVFDLPEVIIREVSVETKRIEADANALEARTTATAARHKAEIAEAVTADLEERKVEVAAQFDTAIAELTASIEDLRSKGVDPANANGTDVLATLEELKRQKAKALAEIDSAKEQSIS